MKSSPVKHQISSGGVIYRPEPDGVRVALIRRSSAKGEDIWCLPKGWVEPGETLEETAVREVSEETGLEGRVIRKLGLITYWFYEKSERRRIHKTVHFFLMEWTGGDTSLHDDEVLEARWFTPVEAEKHLVFPGEKDIFKKARRALAKREVSDAAPKLIWLGLVFGLALSGCVTRATHEALVARYQESDARIGQLNRRIENLQGELDRSRKSLDEALAKLESTRSSRKMDQSDLDLLSEKNVSLSAEVETLRRRNRDLTDAVAVQKTRVENMNAQVEALEFLSKTLSGQVEQFKSEADRSEKVRLERLQGVREVENRLRGALGEAVSAGEILITPAESRIDLRLAQSSLFDSSGLEIKPEGRETLKKIAQVLKESPAMNVEIKGHTDNVPIGPGLADKYPSNWELSTARASRIARFLVTDTGFAPSALSASGFADSRPVADNNTAEGRTQNRRIELSLIPAGGTPIAGTGPSQPDAEVPP